MKLLNLNKKVTVEQIHAEFDSAQERIQCEAEKILKELSIPTETALERKARLAEELGFVNSEVVEKAKVLKKRNEGIAKKLEVTKQQADTLQDLRFHYPNEKFLTVDELNRICEKYGLIHAPIKNYIKDIPEKNLLEMKNAKPLHFFHAAISKSSCTYTLYDWHTKELRDQYVLPREAKYWDNPIVLDKPTSNRWDFEEFLKEKYGATKRISFDKASIDTISFEGYFIAAPKSHFNTKGLIKKSPFGFFNVQTVEIKDPVVFEYCKNGFIRVVTKWGTDDDQSYLDPSLVNDKFN